ncbi:phosphopantetheine-binding protein [Streptomyces sp. IBSNAI002]|uniref:phosphopantetheine-binding protein n=1 Tax=Streptomyces sp. IBSNAI002 TaxID=3457500 RepID=UPI003FD0402F
MSSQNLEKVIADVAELITEVTGVEPPEGKPLGSVELLDDLDIDSLATVEVVVAAEEHFGIQIDDSDAKKLVTVGDVARLVRRRLDQD